MALQIRRLSHALGAEVVGLDISKPLEDGIVSEIRRAFLEYCLLVFRGHPFTRDQHIAFSRQFGDLDMNEARDPNLRVREYPEIFLIISKPSPTGEAATERHVGAGWHTDNSHLPAAAQASLLHGVEVPEIGGDTMFCNLYRAYETLSDGMKKLLNGLYGVHMLDKTVIDNSTPERAAESRRRFPITAHPIVRVHPDTGRKALYLNQQVKLFVGMTMAESKPLIDYLTNHAVRPQNIYRHQWQKDDLVMWDNRCLLHMALADYDRTQVRHMERTTVNATVSGYAYDGPLE